MQYLLSVCNCKKVLWWTVMMNLATDTNYQSTYWVLRSTYWPKEANPKNLRMSTTAYPLRRPAPASKCQSNCSCRRESMSGWLSAVRTPSGRSSGKSRRRRTSTLAACGSSSPGNSCSIGSESATRRFTADTLCKLWSPNTCRRRRRSRLVRYLPARWHHCRQRQLWRRYRTVPIRTRNHRRCRRLSRSWKETQLLARQCYSWCYARDLDLCSPAYLYGTVNVCCSRRYISVVHVTSHLHSMTSFTAFGCDGLRIKLSKYKVDCKNATQQLSLLNWLACLSTLSLNIVARTQNPLSSQDEPTQMLCGESAAQIST